jgi:hypothetical protein
MAGAIGVITGGVVFGGSGAAVLGRILGAGGGVITSATIGSLAYTVTDLTTGLPVAQAVPLAPVASYVFDSLIYDGSWDKDSPAHPGRDGRWGYNFLALLPANLFTAKTQDPITLAWLPHTFQVDVQFTPALVAFPVFRQSWRATPLVTFP